MTEGVKSGIFLCIFVILFVQNVVTTENESGVKCKDLDEKDVKWEYNEKTDSCYHLYAGSQWDKLSWYEADDYCALFNAHLVSIHSKEENEFLVQLIKRNTVYSLSTYWIGLHALGVDGQFEWSDGTLTDYRNWNSKDHEVYQEDKCVFMYYKSGKWKDENCQKHVDGYICKRPNSVDPSPRPTPNPTPMPGYCPKDWSAYGDKCFQFRGDSEITRLSWQAALKTCRSMGANHDLASIHSIGEQMFLTALMGLHKSAAWIGLNQLGKLNNNYGWSDNSRFDFQWWGPSEPSGYSEKCVEMMSANTKTGKWNDYVCDQKQSYICQRYKDPQITSPPPSETDCSSRGLDYVEYHNSCYKLIQEKKKSWQDAENECAKESGHLVSVTNPYEEAFLHSMLMSTNDTVWNGLYSPENEERFRWIDTWPVYYTNWGPKQPENPSTNVTSCVAFDKNKQWKVLPCELKNIFICKVTDLIPPVIDIPGNGGTCPDHLSSWVNVQGSYCFYIEQTSNGKSWSDASLFCRRKGAMLAKFHSLHDIQLLEPYFKSSGSNMWIGLIEKHDGGYEWEDGSSVDFTNWAKGQPSNPDTQLCVEMYRHNSKWNDENCYSKRSYICQVQKVPPEPICETDDGQWKYLKDTDACYHVKANNWVQKYTWYEAEDYCVENGGHLVSIHSKKENDYIHKLVQDKGSFLMSSFWIGFHSLGLDGQFEWTDGSLTEFINWNSNNEHFEAEEKCVIMDATSGTWKDHHCDLKEGNLVCKIPNTKLVTPAPTIEPTPLPGNCPSGWYTFGNKCFFFSEENDKKEVTWEEARQACRNKGPGHDLMSIHSMKEQMFLTSVLGHSKKSAWIGLQRPINEFGRFVWSDNSRFDFDFWGPGEPNSYNERCVEMMGTPPSAGKWNDYKCGGKRAYICQRYKDPNLPESKPPNYHDCSHLEQGYVGYQESCYKVYLEASQVRSWKSAEDFCVSQGGHLTSVTNLFDQAFLYNLLDITTENVWNGFYVQFSQERFRWSDKWPVFYTKWAKGQPTSVSTSKTRCVAFQEEKEWTVVPCENKLSFICKVTELIPPIIDIPHISGSCPQNLDSWINIQGPYCFHFSTDTKSWIDASVFCKKRGGSLARFHSMPELQLIQPYVSDRSRSMWIGLIESHDGGYEWENAIPADFFNWEVGEPSDPDRDHCVELRPQNLKWNDHTCSSVTNYICMVEKENYESKTTTAAPETFIPCDDQSPEWKLFEGNCYLVEKIKYWESHKKLAWHSADDFCRQNGGYLTSIHSEGENSFIKRVIDAVQNAEVGQHLMYWIGLHALGFEGQLEWADGSVLDYVNWEKDNKDEISTDEEKCVIYDGKSGKWTLNHCNLVESLICKRPHGDLPTPIPTNEPPEIEGNCPKGWTSVKQSRKCFKIFGVKDEDKLAWPDARNACRKVGTNGDLATVNSEIEQLLLTAMLTDKRFNVWIGLSRISSKGLLTRTFGWTDNTRVSYVNWTPGSPNSFWKRCVTMLGSSTRAGRWIDSSCSEKQGYVCQQPKDKDLPEQETNYNCNGSLKNYVSYDTGCYQVFSDFNSRKTWKEAENYCREVKGHLTSVINPYEQAFLHLLLKKFKSKVWIGFGSKIGVNHFQWSDQWPVYFTNWGKGQPVTISKNSEPLCVSFLEDGKWNVTRCEEKLPFVCKINRDEPPLIPEPVNEECPSNFSNWLDLGGHYCYYIEDKTRVQWGEASRKCVIKNTTLVSIHSEHELRMLQPYISSLKINVWIGLVLNANGVFRWIDYSPVEYTNWGDKEPNNPATDHCVQLQTEDMVWKTSKCTLYSGYICMVKKVPGQPDVKEIPVDNNEKRIAPWAVAVICLSMIILAGIMISLWCIKRKENTPLKSPPLSFDNIMYVSGTETLSSPEVTTSSSA